jgi:hypothetical protein
MELRRRLARLEPEPLPRFFDLGLAAIKKQDLGRAKEPVAR